MRLGDPHRPLILRRRPTDGMVLPMGDTEPAKGRLIVSGGHDAFSHWREVVCQSFTRLSPERLPRASEERENFDGRIDQIDMAAGASLSRIVASPQMVARSKTDIAAQPCDAVFVNIQVSGRSIVRQREIETVLPAGSMTLLDARQPFAMRFETSFAQFCFHVPLGWFDAQTIDTAPWIVRRVAAHTGGGRAVLAQAYTVFRGATDLVSGSGDPTSGAGDLMALLTAAFEGRDVTLGDEYLALLQAFVRANLSDRALTPASVASHFKISRRYLHKIFARSGMTFGDYLRQQRLLRSRMLLREDPARAVASVARSAGFSSASSFSRAFRLAFGETPRAYRSQSVVAHS